MATFDDSPIPRMTKPIKINNNAIVIGIIGITTQMLCMYFTASLAEITAVAIYDKTVKDAASEAVDFLVVFNNALYAPPFNGNAPTTSP